MGWNPGSCGSLALAACGGSKRRWQQGRVWTTAKSVRVCLSACLPACLPGTAATAGCREAGMQAALRQTVPTPFRPPPPLPHRRAAPAHHAQPAGGRRQGAELAPRCEAEGDGVGVVRALAGGQQPPRGRVQMERAHRCRAQAQQAHTPGWLAGWHKGAGARGGTTQPEGLQQTQRPPCTGRPARAGRPRAAHRYCGAAGKPQLAPGCYRRCRRAAGCRRRRCTHAGALQQQWGAARRLWHK